MITYVKVFSTSFMLALVAWPFLSAFLTLPILAGMYHRYHRLRTSAVLTAYLCVFYALGLMTFTLYPMPDNPAEYCITHATVPQLDPLRFVRDLAVDGKSAALQLLFNVVLFVPLGFALYRWARWRSYAVIPAGLLVSLLIETSQLTGMWHLYPCSYRQFDVNDLMTNTLGAMVGCLIAWAYGLLVPVKRAADADDVNARPDLLHRVVTLAIDMVFVGIVTGTCAIGFAYWFHKTATPLPDGTFRLLGTTFSIGVIDKAVRIAALLAFAVFEVWIPAAHRGQTLGGMFTHMSVETKARQGWLRAVFYAGRTVVLVLALQIFGIGNGTSSNVFGLFGASSARIGWIAIAALALFWLVARQMPYDLIPGSAVGGDGAVTEAAGDGKTGDVGDSVLSKPGPPLASAAPWHGDDSSDKSVYGVEPASASRSDASGRPFATPQPPADPPSFPPSR